jgi:hypothetical protein
VSLEHDPRKETPPVGNGIVPKKKGEEGAWRCDASEHLNGDQYWSSKRSHCDSCGVKKTTGKYTAMKGWDIDSQLTHEGSRRPIPVTYRSEPNRQRLARKHINRTLQESGIYTYSVKGSQSGWWDQRTLRLRILVDASWPQLLEEERRDLWDRYVTYTDPLDLKDALDRAYGERNHATGVFSTSRTQVDADEEDAVRAKLYKKNKSDSQVEPATGKGPESNSSHSIDLTQQKYDLTTYPKKTLARASAPSKSVFQVNSSVLKKPTKSRRSDADIDTATSAGSRSRKPHNTLHARGAGARSAPLFAAYKNSTGVLTEAERQAMRVGLEYDQSKSRAKKQEKTRLKKLAERLDADGREPSSPSSSSDSDSDSDSNSNSSSTDSNLADSSGNEENLQKNSTEGQHPGNESGQGEDPTDLVALSDHEDGARGKEDVGEEEEYAGEQDPAPSSDDPFGIRSGPRQDMPWCTEESMNFPTTSVDDFFDAAEEWHRRNRARLKAWIRYLHDGTWNPEY